MHDNLIILAGGASSRMKKETENQNLTEVEIFQANNRSKGLITVGASGRPIMDYVLFNAKLAGYKNIYIVISEEGKLFKEFYGEKNSENNFHGLSISFAIQYVPEGRIKPFGTADALYQTLEQYPELNQQYYSVCNSDNLYSSKALLALRTTQTENAFISYSRDALDYTPERISRFALVELNKKQELLDIIEKPKLEEVEKYHDTSGKLRVSMNAFRFNGKRFFEYVKNCPVHPERNEKELPTAVLNMLQDYPSSVIGISFSEHVPDLTSKEDIVIVKKYLEENYIKLDWSKNAEI